MTSILRRLASWVSYRAPTTRRVPPAVTRVACVEALESRLLLTPWDYNWQYGPSPGAQPPPQPLPSPPYALEIVTEIDSNVLEVPGHGHALVDHTKVTSKSFKGSFESNNVQGKLTLKGHFQNTSTPFPNDTFEGTLSFTVTSPGSKPVHFKLKIVGEHAP